MKSDRLGHASPSGNGLSGRNADSSIVSLKALVAQADPSHAAVRPPAVDDSGIIDLKALMANAPPSSDALPPVLAPNEAGLFDVPENTPLPHVVQIASLSDRAAENPSSRRGKWLAAAMLVLIAAVGTAGVLQARKPRVAQLQNGVAAAVPVMTSEPNKVVEVPRPMQNAPVVANVAPAPTETKSTDTTTRRTRKAASNSPSRERAPQEPPPVTPKAEEEAPAPAPAAAPCDLRCEIERAARRSTKKKP